MSPAVVILVLLIVAALLSFLELLLPSHGLLGLLAALCFLGGVITCFWVDKWLGLGFVVVSAFAAPFVWAGVVRWWPTSHSGRQMVLQPVDASVSRPPVAVGQEGVAVSELRPMGTAEFGGSRVEVASEFGMIAPATRVRVVSFENNCPVVVAV